MIKNFQLLRNIGQFNNVDDGKDIELGRLTLVYAENGRGKTTLAAVLRSLADHDPVPIVERKRLSSSSPPEIILKLGDGSSTAVFKNGNWNATPTILKVFDDAFVEHNVCSGLGVSPQQRQNLHDVVLGPQAVRMSKQLQEQVEKIENHNHELRNKERAIPASARGPFPLIEFCRLSIDPNIDQAIQEAERNLTAVQKQTAISSAPSFELLNLPQFDLDNIKQVLQMDLESLETATLEKIQAQFITLGQGGEVWVSGGMSHIQQQTNGNSSVSICPFCAQDLDGSDLIQHYRVYFSDTYSELKLTIANMLKEIKSTHGEGVQAEFELKLRIAGERRQFWTQFCQVEEFTLDTSEIFHDCKAARESILSLLTAKQASPLEKVQIPDETKALVAAFGNHIGSLGDINHRLQKANEAIKATKELTASTSVQHLSDELDCLKAIKTRHEHGISEACETYLQEYNAKTVAEQLRDKTRKQLDSYRTTAFHLYEDAVNQYLQKFGTGFHLENMKYQNRRAGSTSTYEAKIDNTSVAVVKPNPEQGQPSFSNVFSGGDRTTLAFAFFFASLDQHPDIGNAIVVIDDPISSMDAYRSLTTVQEIRNLIHRVKQVIVFSHNKPFMCDIWKHANKTDAVALEIVRCQEGSTLRKWSVAEDSLTEHDRRHKVLQEYFDNGKGERREVARAIRPHLEGFLRTACPQEFPPGSSLGNHFILRCEQTLSGATQILAEIKLQELRDILEYAHSFHHDSNPKWASESITDGELRTFVGKTLKFTRPLSD